MAVKSFGTISLNDIQAELGGDNPINLDEYYRGGPYTADVPQNAKVPRTGRISLSDFYGAVGTVEVAYEMIGGGGGGAGAQDLWYGGGAGYPGGAGGASSIASNIVGQIIARGGGGGAIGTSRASLNGNGTIYGGGGAGGANSNSGNDTAGRPPAAGAWGAGGGSGGTWFVQRMGGNGGGAGQRRVGSFRAVRSDVITIVVGQHGDPGYGHPNIGARGERGFVRLILNGVNYDFSSAGTHRFTVPNQ